VPVEKARMKQLMIRSARSVVMLADYTKFGETSTFQVCAIDDIDELITDANVDSVVTEALRGRGLAVTIAPRVDSVVE
jgi:DeoR family transcriptional regulator, aga operon transcriptional repressor